MCTYDQLTSKSLSEIALSPAQRLLSLKHTNIFVVYFPVQELFLTFVCFQLILWHLLPSDSARSSSFRDNFSLLPSAACCICDENRLLQLPPGRSNGKQSSRRSVRLLCFQEQHMSLCDALSFQQASKIPTEPTTRSVELSSEF